MDAYLPSLPPGTLDLVKAGRVFWYTSASAGIIPAAVGTGSAPMLFNGPNSGVNVRIIKVFYGAVSGTVINAHIAYAYHLNPIVTIASTTYVAPVNAFINSGFVSQLGKGGGGGWAPDTSAIGTAPTYWKPNGVSAGGAFAAGPLFTMIDNVDGSILIPPGVAFFPFVSNGALACRSVVSVLAIEEPQ